jgi:hypothetical protein
MTEKKETEQEPTEKISEAERINRYFETQIYGPDNHFKAYDPAEVEQADTRKRNRAGVAAGREYREEYFPNPNPHHDQPRTEYVPTFDDNDVSTDFIDEKKETPAPIENPIMASSALPEPEPESQPEPQPELELLETPQTTTGPITPSIIQATPEQNPSARTSHRRDITENIEITSPPEIEISEKELLSFDEEQKQLAALWADLIARAGNRPSFANNQERKKYQQDSIKQADYLKIRQEAVEEKRIGTSKLKPRQKNKLVELSGQRRNAFLIGDYIKAIDINDKIIDLLKEAEGEKILPKLNEHNLPKKESTSVPASPEPESPIYSNTAEETTTNKNKHLEKLAGETLIVKAGEIYEIDTIENCRVKIEDGGKLTVKESIDSTYDSYGTGKFILEEGGDFSGNVIHHQL